MPQCAARLVLGTVDAWPRERWGLRRAIKPVLALFALLTVLAPARAFAAAPWSAPTDVLAGNLDSVSAAVNARGEGVVAWVRGYAARTRLEVADRRLDGSLTSPVVLDARRGANSVSLIDCGVDAHGGAAVVWASAGRLQLALRSGSAARFRPVLNVEGGAAEDVDLAVASGGDVVMVWHGRSGVWAVAGHNNDRRLGHRRLLRRRAYGPRVALSEDGRGLVAWYRSVRRDRRPRLEAVDRASDGRLGPIRRVPGTSDPDPPSIAVGDDGSAVIAWTRLPFDLETPPERTPWSLFAVTRTPGRGFGPAQRLDHERQYPSLAEPRVAVAPNGTATVAWLYPGAKERGRQIAGAIRVATCPATMRCAPARDVAPVRTDPSDSVPVALADSPRGDRLLVWVDATVQPTPAYIDALRASFAPAGSDFGPVEEVAQERGIDALWGPVAIAPATGSRPQVFWGSGYFLESPGPDRPRLQQAVRG